MIHIACFRDQYFFSEAVIKLIDDRRNFKIDIISNSLSDLLYKIRDHQIDLVVMLQDEDFDSIKQTVICIRKAYVHLPIVYIQLDRDLKKAKELEKTGVHVYLSRMSALNLLDSLHAVVHGHLQAIQGTSIFLPEPDFKLSPGDSSNPFLLLTAHQKKIISLLAEGMDKQRIASACNLSIHTVYKYIQIAKEKCGCQHTKELLKVCGEDIKTELSKMKNLIPEIVEKRTKTNRHMDLKIANV